MVGVGWGTGWGMTEATAQGEEAVPQPACAGLNCCIGHHQANSENVIKICSESNLESVFYIS